MKRDEFKPSIVINGYHQDLLIELLKNYNTYDDLPDNLKSLIDDFNFRMLKDSLFENFSVKPKFSKLMVVVDYINAFVDGSLGSPAAKAIEDKLTERVRKAVEDPGTAVVVLIDAHYNNDGYLNSREGRHLPVLHANTEHERMLHGKLHELFSNLYDSTIGNYNDDIDNGIWFIEKSQFGCDEITNAIDSHITNAVDKVLTLANDKDFDNIPEISNKGDKSSWQWNTIYDTATNLSMVSFVPEDITIVGVATNICVLSNAVLLQTQYPQVEIYIPEDSVASYDNDLHKAALDIMKGLGMNIL